MRLTTHIPPLTGWLACSFGASLHLLYTSMLMCDVTSERPVLSFVGAKRMTKQADYSREHLARGNKLSCNFSNGLKGYYTPTKDLVNRIALQNKPKKQGRKYMGQRSQNKFCDISQGENTFNLTSKRSIKKCIRPPFQNSLVNLRKLHRFVASKTIYKQFQCILFQLYHCRNNINCSK